MDAEEPKVDVPESFRTKLKALLENIGDDEEMRQVLKDAFSVTRLKWATANVACKHCGKDSRTRVQIDAPDYGSYLKVLATVSDQAYGRPKETPVAPVETVEIAEERQRQIIREEIRAALQGDPVLS